MRVAGTLDIESDVRSFRRIYNNSAQSSTFISYSSLHSVSYSHGSCVCFVLWLYVCVRAHSLACSLFQSAYRQFQAKYSITASSPFSAKPVGRRLPASCMHNLRWISICARTHARARARARAQVWARVNTKIAWIVVEVKLFDACQISQFKWK